MLISNFLSSAKNPDSTLCLGKINFGIRQHSRDVLDAANVEVSEKKPQKYKAELSKYLYLFKPNRFTRKPEYSVLSILPLVVKM